MIKVQFEDLEFFGATAFPTSTGQGLYFSETLAKGELIIEEWQRSEDAESPIDVVKTRFRVADSTGALWSAEAKTTTEFFIQRMVDVSSVLAGLVAEAESPADYEATFRRASLVDLRFSSDDRFYREVILGGKIRSFKFHYTTIHFDLAFVTSGEPESPQLVVRVHPNSLLDAENAEDIGAFSYPVEWKHLLLANTAVYSQDYGRWCDNPISAPLVFEETSERGEPNEGITRA